VGVAALRCKVLCVGSNAIRSDHIDMTAHTQMHAHPHTPNTEQQHTGGGNGELHANVRAQFTAGSSSRIRLP